jgi:hypothetical protein
VSWQDPYGQGPQDVPGWQGPQDTSGWQDPYAQPGYGSPYGPPGGVMPPASTGPAIAALVCNIVAALLCCVGIGWLPGIIFSAMALSRASRDPLSSRKLMMWSWICLAISVVIAVVLIVVLVLIGHYQSSDSTT